MFQWFFFFTAMLAESWLPVIQMTPRTNGWKDEGGRCTEKTGWRGGRTQGLQAGRSEQDLDPRLSADQTTLP